MLRCPNKAAAILNIESFTLKNIKRHRLTGNPLRFFLYRFAFCNFRDSCCHFYCITLLICKTCLFDFMNHGIVKIFIHQCQEFPKCVRIGIHKVARF